MKIVNRLLLMGAAAVAASIAKKNMERKSADKDLWATATDNVIPVAGGAAWQGAAMTPGPESELAGDATDDATTSGAAATGAVPDQQSGHPVASSEGIGTGVHPEPARGDAWGSATDHL